MYVINTIGTTSSNSIFRLRTHTYPAKSVYVSDFLACLRTSSDWIVGGMSRECLVVCSPYLVYRGEIKYRQTNITWSLYAEYQGKVVANSS